jgi:WD40 repeat protein
LGACHRSGQIGRAAVRPKLARARGWLTERAHQLSTKEQDFIRASIDQADAEARRKVRDAEQIAEGHKKAALAQKRIAQRTGIGLGAALLLLVVAGWQWWSAENGTISALIQSSEARFATGEDWDSLMTSLRAAKIFRTIPLVHSFDRTIRSQLSQSLQQALYRIHEYKRVNSNRSGYLSRQSAMGQMAWSPNGESLAFVSGRDAVTLWRPDTNSLNSIDLDKDGIQKDGEIQSVSWRPPEETILATSSTKGIIRFYDIGKSLLRPIQTVTDDSNLYGITWRPDGQEVALASFTYGALLYKPDGTRLAAPLPNLTSQVWDVKWSPEPPYTLAAGSFENKIMWNIPGDTSLPCDITVGGWVYSMSWRPDGGLLAAGLSDNTVQLLSRDCKKRLELIGHTGPVSGMSWSSDMRLATASEDRTVRLWDQEGAALDTDLPDDSIRLLQGGTGPAQIGVDRESDEPDRLRVTTKFVGGLCRNPSPVPLKFMGQHAVEQIGRQRHIANQLQPGQRLFDTWQPGPSGITAQLKQQCGR